MAGRYKVAAVSADSGSNVERAVPAATKLVVEDKVNAVVGIYSSNYAPAVVDRTESLGAVAWITSATDSAVFRNRNRKWTFRPQVDTEAFGVVSVRYLQAVAQSYLGRAPMALRVAVISEDNAFSQAIAEANLAEAKRLGIPVVYTGAYGKTTALADFFGKLKLANPDVVLHAGYDPTPLWAQMRGHDIRVQAMLGQAMFQTAKSIQDRGLARELDGFHTTTGIDPAWLDLTKLTPAAAATVRAAAAELLPKYPNGVPNFTWTAFNATWVLLNDVLPRAIARHGGTTPAAIAAAARATDIPDGGTVQGYGVRFYPPEHELAGQNERAYTGLSQAINGEFTLVFPQSIARALPKLPYSAGSPFARSTQ